MDMQRYDELTELLTGDARAAERTALQPAEWAELLREYHQLKHKDGIKMKTKLTKAQGDLARL